MGYSSARSPRWRAAWRVGPARDYWRRLGPPAPGVPFPSAGHCWPPWKPLPVSVRFVPLFGCRLRLAAAHQRRAVGCTSCHIGRRPARGRVRPNRPTESLPPIGPAPRQKGVVSPRVPPCPHAANAPAASCDGGWRGLSPLWRLPVPAWAWCAEPSWLCPSRLPAEAASSRANARCTLRSSGAALASVFAEPSESPRF